MENGLAGSESPSAPTRGAHFAAFCTTPSNSFVKTFGTLPGISVPLLGRPLQSHRKQRHPEAPKRVEFGNGVNSCDVEVSVDCWHEPIARIATGGQSKSCVVVWHSLSGDLGEGVVMVDLPVEGQIRVRVKPRSTA